MDFVDQLKQFSTRVAQLSPVIGTEEATKNSLILPFFQMLGYDVFNPVEFVPEYTADVGIKKGEKVDYAIIRDGKPIVLIEAKWCGENLQSHDSQLFRYFGTSCAKLAILTNGIIYRFYTDLDEANKMDLTPFMELDIFDIKDSLVQELKRFQRDALDVDSIFSAASDLKYSTAIKKLLDKQANDPDDEFIKYILHEVYPGLRTVQVIEKFRSIIKRSFLQYVNELLKDRFKSMLMPPEEKQKADTQSETSETEETADDNQINTTAEEVEAFLIIKALIHDVVEPSRITYKDTASYFGVLLDNKATKWICRLQIENRKKFIYFPLKDGNKDLRIVIINNDSIYQYKDHLIKSVQKYL
jgi:predicted type IV restriction endonuclease